MKILLVTAFIWTFATCTLPERKESANVLERQEFILPADWKRINTSNVEFSVPPNLSEKEYKEMMPSSTAKFYGNENIWLVFTIQSKPSSSYKNSKERDFQFEKAIIDGKQAEISTFTGTDMQNEANGEDYVATLDVPQIQGNGESLKMWAYCKSSEDREIVIKIFKSVRFLKE